MWSAVQDVLPKFELDAHSHVLLGIVHCKPTQINGVVLEFHIYHALEEQQSCSAVELAQLSLSTKAWLLEC
eukprot:1050434-Karenia_brevis.AAC.1